MLPGDLSALCLYVCVLFCVFVCCVVYILYCHAFVCPFSVISMSMYLHVCLPACLCSIYPMYTVCLYVGVSCKIRIGFNHSFSHSFFLLFIVLPYASRFPSFELANFCLTSRPNDLSIVCRCLRISLSLFPYFSFFLKSLHLTFSELSSSSFYFLHTHTHAHYTLFFSFTCSFYNSSISLSLPRY